MPTIRFMWIDDVAGLQGYQGDVASSVLWDGRIAPNAPGFPGRAGDFIRLSDDHSFAIDSQDTAPVFLHESLRASMETWMQPIRDSAEEPAAAARARDAVIALVESRVAQGSVLQTFSTVTRTEPANGGHAVVGRCVVIERA